MYSATIGIVVLQLASIVTASWLSSMFQTVNCPTAGIQGALDGAFRTANIRSPLACAEICMATPNCQAWIWNGLSCVANINTSMLICPLNGTQTGTTQDMTSVHVSIDIMMNVQDIVSCPIDFPNLAESGLFCCKWKMKIKNATINSLCDGGFLQNSDPVQCCNESIMCNNALSGCSPWQDQNHCPYKYPYAINNGQECCGNLASLNIPGTNPDCSDGALLTSSPSTCCKGQSVACKSAQGCHTRMDSQYNATKLLIMGNAFNDSVMTLSTGTLTIGSPASDWPGRFSSTRGYMPFGGAFNNLMIMCEALSGPNKCYTYSLGMPAGWYTETELFDFLTGSWSYGPAIPISTLASTQWGSAAPLDENRVLIYGGTSGGVSLANTYLYDFSTDTWSAMASMATPRHSFGAGSIMMDDGTMVALAVGGFYQQAGTPQNTIEYYNPVTNTWTVTPGKLTKTTYLNYGCVANNNLILLGGYNVAGGAKSNQNIQFSPESLLNGTSPFKVLANLPSADYTVACIPFQ